MDLQLLLDRLKAFDAPLFSLGGVSFSAASVLRLLVLLAALFWVSSAFRRLMVRRLLLHTPLDLGTREAVGSIARYLVLVIGIALILQNVGINLTALSVVAGAVGVGVGFGLQNIFSNFISGIIIMFERPIKIGDRVEVAGVEGTVREIGARRTTIFTLDNVAILVPNQHFIVNNVVNHTYADAPIRLRVPVQAAAGTDPDALCKLLVEAAHSQPGVLPAPEPKVLLTSLGGAAMTFELTVWHHAAGPHRQQLASDLNFLIERRMQAAGLRGA
jgi:small-conductance mechanosensitive channel